MTYIIIVVAVIVGMLFLLVFNIAASKKSRPRGSRPMPTANDDGVAAVQAVPAISGKSDDTTASRNETTRVNLAASGRETGSGDHSYRQALRNFSEERANAKPGLHTKSKTADDEYRKALRDLHKKE